jgi:hypothetical protein
VRPEQGARLALATAAVLLSVISIATISYDHQLSRRVTASLGTNDLNWVDDFGFEDVAVLQTPLSDRGHTTGQLFWNRSLTRVLRMPGAAEVDAYGSKLTQVADDGRILASGRVVTTPLLVQEGASTAELDGAKLIARKANTALWKVDGVARMSLLLTGRHADGWLGTRSELTIWPTASGPRVGVVRMTLTAPRALEKAALIELRGPSLQRVIRVEPGATRVLRLNVTARRPWRLQLRPRRQVILTDGRTVGVLASMPRLVAGDSRTRKR